ncbi:MAG: molybdopterin-dependent oxidoreductase [Raoultibacter sp.]
MTEEIDIHAPGVEVKKSCCYFCHQNCGVLAYVKDGKVLKIEGDPNHPTNTGGLCCRGNIALKHLDHPARLNHALKRVGKRGDNNWEKIPWDQAITEIGAKLNEIKEESGAEAIATAGGTLRTEDWARRRFMNIFGSPNSFHNALLCWIPTFMMETAISGWSPFETDLGDSNCVILWGFNPGASGMPGMKGYTDLQKNGLKLIVVDPRYSETASKADLWLPLRPGSDTALSLAMVNVIIYEGLYDADFVQNWCVGWDELVEHMGQYTPEWAAPLTWLEPEQIRAAARLYAKSAPSNIQWGCTADQLGTASGAGMHARAIMRAITGNLDRPGGDLMPGPSFGYLTDEEIEANDWLPEEQKAKQIGSDKFKLTSWPGYQRIADVAKETWGKAPTAEWMCEAHGPSVFKAILTGDPYKVRALIVSATNPVNSYGDAKMTLQALKEVEFLVTCDYWMTPAALYSDYVMPIAGALERPTIHTNYGVTDSIVASQRAIQPLYDRHTDYIFWHDLALATGQPADQWPWDNEEEAFYYIISPLNYPVENYDEFVENYRMYYPPLRYYKYGDNGFNTPSRRVELKSSILEELGYPALPTYIGCAENETDNPELAEEFPLVLTTGGGFMPYHHSEQFQIESVRYLYHDPYFSINPQKASELGIKEGDWCWIETRRGRIKQRASVEPAVAERVIYAQRGWWYPERGVGDPEEPFGCLESNVNVLTSVDDEHCDPIGGSWANRGLLCKVYKVAYLDKDKKSDTQYSIPGSSSQPGISVMPRDSKLAYEPIPYDPKPTFEVPEGLTWCKTNKVAYQEATGHVYDPDSGWLIDQESQVYYDLVTGYAYDPTENNLVDMETGKRYDMETREEIVAEQAVPETREVEEVVPEATEQATPAAEKGEE